jgi:hypothetical protein
LGIAARNEMRGNDMHRARTKLQIGESARARTRKNDDIAAIKYRFFKQVSSPNQIKHRILWIYRHTAPQKLLLLAPNIRFKSTKYR